jgi:uncharacterized repeat protein (TIGR01451 family)
MGVAITKKLCRFAAFIVILFSISQMAFIGNGSSQTTQLYTIEIEISQYTILQDLDGFLAPYPDRIAEPYFKINILGVDDDSNPSIVDDEDWFSSFYSIAKLPYLFNNDLGTPFLGPIYIPKETVSLPLTLIITAYDWDSALPGMSDQLIIQNTIQISSLPYTQTISNNDIQISFSVRIISDKAYDNTYNSNFEDPMINDQWSFFDTKSNYVSYYYGGQFSETTVAVIDSGVNYNYPDLLNVMWKNTGEIRGNNVDDDGNGYVDDWNGFDFVAANKIGSLWYQDTDGPLDEDGHGTFMAGILGAERNNIGIVGLAPNVKIMPIRVLGHFPDDPGNMAEAIKYATIMGADVITMSLGPGEFNSEPQYDPSVQNAILDAYARGIFLVAAAGNEKTIKVGYPGEYSKVSIVSGLQRLNLVGSLLEPTATPTNPSTIVFADQWRTGGGSNYGPDSTQPNSVEFCAPSTSICSIMLDEIDFGDGTSCACPMVAAVAAMVIGYSDYKYHTELTCDQLKSILRLSSTDLGPTGWDPYYGYGMVNSYQALRQVDSLFAATFEGGPDAFGYRYISSNMINGPVYNWLDISGTGTQILPNSDDQYLGNINLGFFFNYYGTDYSQLAIGNNGILFSGTGAYNYINEPITQTSTIHGFIAPYWDDLVTWNTAGAIYYKTLGVSPNRQFVVQWNDTQHFHDSSSGATFEVIIYEGTNNIVFQYKDVSFGTVTDSTSNDRPPYENGGSATVGIEDPTGRIGLQYSYNQQVITSSLAILFKFPQVSGTNMHLSMQAPVSMDRGNQLTYTVHYNNFGSIAASTTTLNTIIPSTVQFISASDSGTYNPSTKTVSWSLGSVAAFPSGRGYRTITVSIPSDISVETSLQGISSVTTSTFETRYDDNTASTTTIVTGSSLPTGVSIVPTVGTSRGEPSIWWTNPITFTYSSTTATGVDIRIHLDDGGSDITGGMTGGSPIWTFTTTFYPRLGHATVTYTIRGPTTSSINFNVYVDPAGYIYDTETLERIANATVWLQRPDGTGGWENVSTRANPANMVPNNNPLTTNVNGQYQWDTLPGTYRVHVEARYYYPADSISINVPPPVTNLNIGLTRMPSPNGSITINNGDYSTTSQNVTLTLTYYDATSGVSGVRFSNDMATWTSWENASATKTWTLTSGEGIKTVYYQIINNAGTPSRTFNDTINLQFPTPTSSSTSGTSSTSNPTPKPTSTALPTPNIQEYNITILNSIPASGTITINNTLIQIPSNYTCTGNIIIHAQPSNGYIFESWLTTGNITIKNQTAQTTEGIINSPGSIRAIFIQEQPSDEGVNIYLWIAAIGFCIIASITALMYFYSHRKLQRTLKTKNLPKSPYVVGTNVQICRTCGQTNRNTAKFCRKCGKKI